MWVDIYACKYICINEMCTEHHHHHLQVPSRPFLVAFSTSNNIYSTTSFAHFLVHDGSHEKDDANKTDGSNHRSKSSCTITTATELTLTLLRISW